MTDTSHSQDSHRKTTWMRGLYMLIIALFMNLAGTVIAVVALVQFVWLLINNERNDGLSAFGRSIGKWVSQAISFETMNTEEKPFPWAEWPSED